MWYPKCIIILPPPPYPQSVNTPIIIISPYHLHLPRPLSPAPPPPSLIHNHHLPVPPPQQISSELESAYDDVIAPAEIATYGALLALATYSRRQLRTDLIDNVGFREFLETAPEVREVVNDFFLARYHTCLMGLERLRGQLLLDMHLHAHVDALYKYVVLVVGVGGWKSQERWVVYVLCVYVIRVIHVVCI